jgi:hypothetical protein
LDFSLLYFSHKVSHVGGDIHEADVVLEIKKSLCLGNIIDSDSEVVQSIFKEILNDGLYGLWLFRFGFVGVALVEGCLQLII